MKALSLWQPWATLVALKIKEYETRSWGTGYRGELAIHAAKRKMGDYEHRLINHLAERLLMPELAKPDTYPLGSVVAVTRLEGCYHMIKDREAEPKEIDIAEQDSLELLVGNWMPRRLAWKFTDVEMLEHPIPARGAQGLWLWNDTQIPLAGLLTGRGDE